MLADGHCGCCGDSQNCWIGQLHKETDQTCPKVCVIVSAVSTHLVRGNGCFDMDAIDVVCYVQ